MIKQSFGRYQGVVMVSALLFILTIPDMPIRYVAAGLGSALCFAIVLFSRES